VKSRIISLVLFCSVLPCMAQNSVPGEKKDDPRKAEIKKLEGAWVEVHAFAKEKPKGRGSVYAWVFKDEKVQRHHTQTLDGEPLIGSAHAGTYTLDGTGKQMAIDIILKSPAGEDWKYLGIYKFEGDRLLLCLSKEKRPATIENKEDNQLYVLQRPPKE
jgi:uncharacterized protein (TIGR03067 family)